MKIFIILAIFASIIVVFQSFIVMSTNRTEEQKYEKVRDFEGFEIRYYPSTTIATIQSTAKTYRELSGYGFQKLAGYIFGGNEANTKISMTSPVQMDVNDTVSSMSFVMPNGYNKDNLPKPNDPNVKITTTADEYVAVIQFGGYASDKDLRFYSEKLREMLQKNGITPYGNFRYLGYNPPFQLVGRRNEIIVSVVWNEQSDKE